VLGGLPNLNGSTRLKVNRDTFFIPDSNGGVYFRNNSSSFKMEGSSIYQWIEKLLPMFNGEHSLESLTDNLPKIYRDRVFEIGEILYNNGFARDVSKDLPHQLSDGILKKYASQIEFLNSFGDSGAYRFQAYRNAKVLGIGKGNFIISLASSLLESGIPKITLFITSNEETDKKRLKELVENARITDQDVEIEFINKEVKNLREIVLPFDSILYVSEEDEVEELKGLNKICKSEKKRFIPAICSNRIGIAGPLVNPQSEGCFESAWRSIHETAFYNEEKIKPFSSITSAMLANIIVFELFKDITKSQELENNNQIYLINHETLEGNWHKFIPHPIVTESVKAEMVKDFDARLKQDHISGNQSNFFQFMGQLTSEESGVFHIWDEGDLNQLPLAQCQIQVVNPLSDGPVKLLPKLVCTNLTHEEARKEAAFIGIEMYASKIANSFKDNLKSKFPEIKDSKESFSIGTGETFSECICRGLQKCLSEEINKKNRKLKNNVIEVKLDRVEDERTAFYLKSLKILNGVPKIALGEQVFGFPVVWVRTKGKWYRSPGLNLTIALREALKQALTETQNKTVHHNSIAFKNSSILIKENESTGLSIPNCSSIKHAELLKSSVKILEENNKKIITLELMIEQFKVEELAGVYGVLLQEV
jgi:putative thiazole-containing bacteriocin maturation protein